MNWYKRNVCLLFKKRKHHNFILQQNFCKTKWQSNGKFCMDSTKAVTYPRHMVHLETNLSTVYIQNSRIQARSGGKPPFHLGWQLELHWKKLWNVSSFAHRTCARFQQLLARNAGRAGPSRQLQLLPRLTCCRTPATERASPGGARRPLPGRPAEPADTSQRLRSSCPRGPRSPEENRLKACAENTVLDRSRRAL